MSTDELSERLILARRHVPFVQANLIATADDDPALVERWRERLRGEGVWANDPVPLYPYPSSPDYRRLWGEPDERAWERAHAHYLAQFQHFSDIQEQEPLPLAGAGDGMSAVLMPGRPARVLLSTDAVGGVWSYTIDLARGLADRGVERVMAVLGPPPTAGKVAASQGNIRLAHGRDRLAARLDGANAGRDLVRSGGTGSPSLERRALIACICIRHRSARGRDVRVPVVAVAHSCVATWWRAVRRGPLPADFRWRPDPCERACRALTR